MRWLHISDAHFKADASYSQDVVTNSLIKSMPTLTERNGVIDCVFFTGDISYSGKLKEFEVASEFLDKLLDSLSLDRSRLFVVPGNHDVERSAGKGLFRSLSDQEGSDVYFDPSEPLPHVEARKKNFISWYRDYFSGIDSYNTNSSVIFQRRLSLNNLEFQVVGIDTSIFSYDDADHAKLWVGRRSVSDLEATTEPEVCNILMMHHPFDWLHPIDASRVERVLVNWSDAILSGHLHKPKTVSCNDAQTAYADLSAGAIFQTEKLPNRAFICNLQNNILDIVPIKFTSDPNEAWALDTGYFPDSHDYHGRFLIRSGAEVSQLEPSGPSITENFHDEDVFVSTQKELLYVEPRLATRVTTGSIDSEKPLEDLSVDDLVRSEDSFVIFSRPEFGASLLGKRLHFDMKKLGKSVELRDARTLPNYGKKLDKDLRAASGAIPETVIVDNFDSERDEKMLRELKSLTDVRRVLLLSVDRSLRRAMAVSGPALPFEPKEAHLLPLNRNSIRDLAVKIMGAADGPEIGEVVDKVYSDLLSLCIPLTPPTVVMYLRVLVREGDYTPLNRVDIFTHFLETVLRRPSDVATGSLSARNKMDILSSIAFDMDERGVESVSHAEWSAAIVQYKDRNLLEFDEVVLLGELTELKVLTQEAGRVSFRYSFYFAYFYGRAVVSKADRYRDYIASERYLRVRSAVDVITGLSTDNTELITHLSAKLAGLQARFAEKYFGLEFDPMADAKWINLEGDQEKFWEPIRKALTEGPKASREIDELKSTWLAESKTYDQELVFRNFQELESEFFAVSNVLSEALLNSDELARELKLSVLEQFIQSQHTAYQIGMSFWDLIVGSRYFIWGSIAFIDFDRAVRTLESGAAERQIVAIDAIARTVAKKAADDIGSKKIGPALLALPIPSEFSFRELIKFRSIIHSRSAHWEKGAEKYILSAPRDSYYLYAMLMALMSLLQREVMPSGERMRAERLVALIRAKRELRKERPGEKLVTGMLKHLRKNNQFDRDDADDEDKLD